MFTKISATLALARLIPFTSMEEHARLERHAKEGDDQEYFRRRLIRVAECAAALDGTDVTNDVAYIHLSTTGCDWYLTSRPSMFMAHGVVVMNGNATSGPIDLSAIRGLKNLEIDLDWEPMTLAART